MNLNTIIVILFIGITSHFTSWVKSDVIELHEKDIQNTIENHLFVFVMFYFPIGWACMGTRTHQPGFQNFDEAAKVAKENGLTRRFNLKFGKVNVEVESQLASKYSVSGYQSCSDHPKFILFKYGEPIRYASDQHYAGGIYGDIGKYSLSEHQLTTQGMFEFLEKNTNTLIQFIETKEELDKLVNGTESSVIGYLQESSKLRISFWKSAEEKKDYIWGAIVTQSLNEYKVDTIVATREFGAKRMILDKDLSGQRIKSFVELSAIPYLLKLTGINLQDEIDNNLLVFVLFHDPGCPIPDYFAKGALTAQQNGIARFLGLKFGKVNIKQEESKNLVSKYNLPNESGCGRQFRKMILFRYGKSVPYSSGFSTDKTETIKGLFDWLEKSTKPSVKIIQTDYELWRFAEFTEVTILGYFKDPKTKVRFWSVADEFKDFMWADVTNPDLNPFDVDTIIINQEYGVVRLRMNDTMSKENIERFVVTNANSSSFPVPTKKPRPDTDMELDYYHREQRYVFIYDGSFFIGDFLQIKLQDTECTDTSKGNWTLGIRSAKTFGQCMKIYDTLNCGPSSHSPSGNPLVLDDANFPVHVDFGRAEFYSIVRSVSSCHYKSTGSTASAHTYLFKLLIVPAAIPALFVMLITPGL